MLWLFLRRLSEADPKKGDGQQRIEFAAAGSPRKSEAQKAELPAGAKQSAGNFREVFPALSGKLAGLPGALAKIIAALARWIKKISASAAKPVWRYMLEAKDLKQSQALASKFARLMPNRTKAGNIGAYNKIKKAERLVSEGKHGEAERVYFEIVLKHPHEYAAYEGLVKIYLTQKKYPEIVETLEYLIKHNPANDHYFAQLGNVLMTTRRYKEALAAYEKSLELNPLIPARFVNAGLCREAIGDYEGAREFLEKAIGLEPSNIQYVMMTADLLLRQENREAARKHLERAADIDPDNALVRERLTELK